MLLRVSNPYRTVNDYFSVKSNFDKLLDSFFNDSTMPLTGTPNVLKASIKDEGVSLVMVVEAPGFSKENIKISSNNNVITVSAQRDMEPVDENYKIMRNERVFGKFERSFQIPVEINFEKAEAEYKDGILKVILPKAEKAKPKEIVIK